MAASSTRLAQRRRNLDEQLRAMFEALKRGTPAELMATLAKLEASEAEAGAA